VGQFQLPFSSDDLYLLKEI